ncbi:MAG: hypothetical protein F6K04_02630 [Leptolyngbya sp. SIO4C5]|nr:hypothetical protein [Leptolyngbya sp. SIO4C5]
MLNLAVIPAYFAARPVQWLSLGLLALTGPLVQVAQAQGEPPFPRSPGGSRGDVCPLAPLAVPRSALTLWSDRPLFLWQGSLSRLQIVTAETDEVLWQADPEAGTTQIQYGAEMPLQPGQEYIWKIYGGPFAVEQLRIPFRIMALERQAVIADELRVLNTQLALEQADLEAQVLRQVTYFADQYLWADALQVAATAPTGTEAAESYLQAAIAQTCGSEDPEAMTAPDQPE